MTDMTLPSSQGPAPDFVSIVDQLARVADALEPFAKAFLALPSNIRRQPDRNLADVLGVFAPELNQQLTVNDLMKATEAFALVSADSNVTEAVIEIASGGSAGWPHERRPSPVRRPPPDRPQAREGRRPARRRAQLPEMRLHRRRLPAVHQEDRPALPLGRPAPLQRVRVKKL